ncbi:MAG: hypothetical protein IMZ59_03965 [Actinobacteria bacterium]|nr:hypothetical protein [Actinomycetota bacterium]
METFLKEFKKTHPKEELLSYLDKIKDLDVIIIGETIQDVYQYGTTLGKSGKSPIIAFENKRKERYDGGILAIRNHLKEFTHKVDYYTDEIMVVKKRYIQEGQKLFETYTTQKNKYKSNYTDINNYDLVVIADFGHGFLTKERRNDISDKANYLALNTQLNAGNMGMNTINKYSKWNYISIGGNELRLATSNQFDDLNTILLDNFNKGTISITEGKHGCIVFKDRIIKYIPIVPVIKEVIDPIGAGDAFFAISSPIAFLNAPPEIIGFMGNLAGNMTCNYQGNKYHVTKNKLLDNIENIYD